MKLHLSDDDLFYETPESREHRIAKMRNKKSLENARQTSSLKPFPEYEPGIFSSSKTVVIGKKVRRITLLRYLVSKVVYNLESIELRDVLAVYSCLIDVQSLSERDPTFNQKFGSTLEVLAKLLKGVKFTKLDEKNLKKLRKALVNTPENFLYPKRNLAQIKAKVGGTYSLSLLKSSGIETRKLPPKLYIGKGYSDKGTARDPAIDGSPRWQDVAMSEVVK